MVSFWRDEAQGFVNNKGGALRNYYLLIRSIIWRRIHTDCLCNRCHLRPVRGTSEQIAALVARCPM